MVTKQSVEAQLKKIGFSTNAWNRSECLELAAILLPDEKIFECVNGWYEGGVALLCATDIRILLVDKKPFKYLTVEDLRFDTINQIDYAHRLMDAQIHVNAGMTTLRFRSYNKLRLRKLIGHVQHRMAEIKAELKNHSVNQQEHLHKIDSQLQTYLLNQYQSSGSDSASTLPGYAADPTNLDLPVISDKAQTFYTPEPGLQDKSGHSPAVHYTYTDVPVDVSGIGITRDDLYKEGIKEIFGSQLPVAKTFTASTNDNKATTPDSTSSRDHPFNIAISKLPILLKKRQSEATELLKNSVSGHSYTSVSENA